MGGSGAGVPGPLIMANAVYTSVQGARALGRPLGAAATVTVNVVQPGNLYGERISQFDMGLVKTFTVGRNRIQGIFDMYNAFNGNAVVAVNNTYGTKGSTWAVPQRILPARLFAFGVLVSF